MLGVKKLFHGFVRYETFVEVARKADLGYNFSKLVSLTYFTVGDNVGEVFAEADIRREWKA